MLCIKNSSIWFSFDILMSRLSLLAAKDKCQWIYVISGELFFWSTLYLITWLDYQWFLYKISCLQIPSRHFKGVEHFFGFLGCCHFATKPYEDCCNVWVALQIPKTSKHWPQQHFWVGKQSEWVVHASLLVQWFWKQRDWSYWHFLFSSHSYVSHWFCGMTFFSFWAKSSS